MTATAVAAANAMHSSALQLHEAAGNSLAEMAQRDLDAALQLLADRALYITRSTGAAIALRRQGKNDMLCRASTGASAPGLGSLLSTEIGLSGESVRTRRALLCQDVQRDVRVNRDVCREMGIASVIVMPVVNDDQVLGVFEIFSGKVSAFDERDLFALQRLSEMVETAVKLAQATESISRQLASTEFPIAEVPAMEVQEQELPETESKLSSVAPVAVQTTETLTVTSVPTFSAEKTPQAAPLLRESLPAGTPKKPLFWSAALNLNVDADKPGASAPVPDQSHVPPVLRTLRKCEACGFPVSAGRALCVECEEKKWRGQLRRSNPLPMPSTPVAPRAVSAPAQTVPEFSAPVARLQAAAGKSGAATVAAPAPAIVTTSSAPAVVQGAFVSDVPKMPVKAASVEAGLVPAVLTPAAHTVPISKPDTISVAKTAPQAAGPELILSAAMSPKQSWFSANKYILGALLLVAATVAAILLLR
jgi:hypothetical protein